MTQSASDIRNAAWEKEFLARTQPAQNIQVWLVDQLSYVDESTPMHEATATAGPIQQDGNKFTRLVSVEGSREWVEAIYRPEMNRWTIDNA